MAKAFAALATFGMTWNDFRNGFNKNDVKSLKSIKKSAHSWLQLRLQQMFWEANTGHLASGSRMHADAFGQIFMFTHWYHFGPHNDMTHHWLHQKSETLSKDIKGLTQAAIAAPKVKTLGL